MTKATFKCYFCPVCDGRKCVDQMPGMGGVNNNKNFILNCSDWKKIREKYSLQLPLIPTNKQVLRIAPVTGAIENIGYSDERLFYKDYVNAAYESGIGITLGDGFPDEKLKAGIKAVEQIQEKDSSVKATLFLKPYQNDQILERVSWSNSIAEIIGIDIDSYNIATMRNLVNLEKKTAEQLLQIKKKLKIPFAIKGIFTEDGIDLVKKVLPDIVVISNHGGRINTEISSTAQFLLKHGKTLSNYCNEIWVDGGIRFKEDIQTALALGAQKVMVARPFITALCKGGNKEFINMVSKFLT